MRNEIVFLVLGGLIGYIGALINHKLESKRIKLSELRQEKLKIYSAVLSEMSASFMNSENILNEFKNPVNLTIFTMKLGKILAPARLIASKRLMELLRDLYEKEVAWYNLIINNNTTNYNEIANISLKARYIVEEEMRRELEKDI